MKMDDIAVFIEKYGMGHIVAATQNGRLINLLIDPPDLNDGSQMGSIVTAMLNEPKKGINGRFVTLPNNKKGFLKDPIDSRTHSLIPVIVGLAVESHKAQPVTSKLLFKGRYVILTPGRPGINISRRIKCEIKRNDILRVLSEVRLILPEKCGLIVRSLAIDAEPFDIILETKEKLNQYELILNNESSEPRIVIGPKKARERAIVDWEYAHPRSIIEERSCFDRFSIWEQISKFLLDKVELENGGFILIELTSALVAVDVNTGSDLSYAGALKTNLFAMKELPRQLEIRGIGGKIVVEFAPLKKNDRIKIESELKTALKFYNSQCTVVGWTKLGNLELQKKRDKQPISKLLHCN